MVHFFLVLGIVAPLLRAVSRAAAMACFCGRPLRTISRMLALMVFLAVPFASGMATSIVECVDERHEGRWTRRQTGRHADCRQSHESPGEPVPLSVRCPVEQGFVRVTLCQPLLGELAKQYGFHRIDQGDSGVCGHFVHVADYPHLEKLKQYNLRILTILPRQSEDEIT
jgi:hypothetical protein